MSSLGYGNPRYNSMLAYGEHLLLSSGAHLRQIVVVTGEVLTDQQIGHSQIFQIMENHRYILDNLRFILVINFEGLLSLLSREDLQIVHQFHASGK